MGQFWGVSDDHSSLMATVCPLSTGYISTQFHLVFDDIFRTVIFTRDYESVFNAICNDLFQLNSYWYAKYDHYDTGKFIYQPPLLEDVWLDEQIFRYRRHELENQRRRREGFIRENNRDVLGIIPLNTKDNNVRPPTGAPVSDDNSIVDYLLGHRHIESQGYFVSDDSYDGSPNSPSPYSNISSPSQPSPPNNSKEGDISREGAQAEPERKFQRKQWP